MNEISATVKVSKTETSSGVVVSNRDESFLQLARHFHDSQCQKKLYPDPTQGAGDRARVCVCVWHVGVCWLIPWFNSVTQGKQ
jgi:hypothetical protein